MTELSPAHRAASDGARRRRRGGRGRGSRPTTNQPAVHMPATPAGHAPAAPAIPAGTAPTALPTDTTFAALGVPAPLVETLTAGGITAPFPIQVSTLPDSLAGRDVLGRGRTG